MESRAMKKTAAVGLGTALACSLVMVGPPAHAEGLPLPVARPETQQVSPAGLARLDATAAARDRGWGATPG